MWIFIADWLMKNGFLMDKRVCPECGEDMQLKSVSEKKTSDRLLWRCRHERGEKKHDIALSIRHGSWFASANFTLKKMLEFTYLWTTGVPPQ